ncbi:hypothetical protein [Delftia tsuruhatensis]|uniref:hypothetical protein n=1 Tax=Delftia tsuruhatensis TaxID=180282 RepID=UPI00202818DC|nr:hypothetical protein [Delftia tsuruhatensis]
MTTAPTPEEFHALAARLEHCVAKWGKQNALSLEAYSAVKMMRRLQAENERLRGDYALRGAQIQRMAALIDELEGKVGRFQGVPLPLIEAINAATGSNEWQGDHSPAELLEPACRAITALVERKNACIHKLEMDALDLASENSILKRQEQDELEASKPLPLSDEQIEKLREQTFSTNNPFCPCDSKTMRKAVRAAERAHGIKET